jgi:hypothetical protein
VPLEPFVSSELTHLARYDSALKKLKVLRMWPGSEVNPDYFLMALTINSRTTAPTVAITNWPINP